MNPLFFFFAAILTIRSGLAAFTNCGFSSDLNFAPWGVGFETDLPTLFPKSEGELRNVILTARGNGCRVRPVGATHSTSGIVAHKGEKNVVTVNLADVNVPAFWQFQLDEQNLLVRVPAGASLFQLNAFIRPKGYLLPSQTAGWLFSVGGVFLAPSVHGAARNEDRLTTLMMGIRAMKADGTIVDERGEQAIRKWRGSMGYFGIATAVELRVRRDGGLFSTPDKFKLSPWTESKVTSEFMRSTKGFDAFEYFWNTYTDEVVVTRYDFNGDPSFNPASTQATYDNLREANKDIARKAATNPLQKKVTLALNTLSGKALTIAGFATIVSASSDRNGLPRDGYVQGPAAFFSDEISAFIPCPDDCIEDGTLFGIMDRTRTYYAGTQNKFPATPTSFRFINVKDSEVFVLNNLPKGRYISFQQSAPRGGTDDRDQGLAPFLVGLEREWDAFTGGKAQYHLGKTWGWANIAGSGLPRPYPFQSDAKAANTFTAAQMSKFLQIANQYDPEGVFRAGELGRLLGISNAKFEPRRGNKEESQGASTSCKTFGGPECLSNCCCDNFWCNLGWKNQCAIRGKARGTTCFVGCACASGTCSWGRCR